MKKIGVILIYADSDEIHQYFVPGRSSRVKDVGFDFFGGILAVILFSVGELFYKRYKLKKM